VNYLQYNTVEDVCAAARQIRDCLSRQGEQQAAREIDETIGVFWTTSSEALGEIRLTLLGVREAAERINDRSILDLLDSAIEGARKLS
jgi:hypothetical protein